MTHPLSSARTRMVLALLFTGAFIMGCAEMLVVSLIDLISADLSVSVPAAGALVTATALGLAVGGPVLAFLTTRLDRRTVLLLASGAFVLANLLPAFGAGYVPFLVARVVTGAAQGLFIAAAMVIAGAVVRPGREGQAMGLVISGFATASALGLPLGTLLGQLVGWRGSFVAIVALGVAILAAAVALVPSIPTVERRALGQARAALAPRVLALLGLCALIFVAVQSALTYVVPYLDQVTGIDGPTVTVFLLAYGVATTVGSLLGGRFTDRHARRALVVGTAGVTASLLVWFLFGSAWPVALGAIFGLGFFAMGMAPSLQHRVATLAGAGAALAASMPASAVNAGIAVGSSVGGAAIGFGGVSATVAVAAVVAFVSIGAAAVTNRIHPPTTPANRPTTEPTTDTAESVQSKGAAA